MTTDKGGELLAELHYEYITRTAACEAVKHFTKLKVTSGQGGRLRVLLRHHDEKEISDDETWLRDQYDYLLSFYSLVEVACAMGLMPVLPRQFVKEAVTFLSDRWVRRYYEENYPLLLPELLRCRLSGSPLKIESAIPDAEEVFEQFRVMGSVVDQGDEETDAFLWLIDGGSYEGETISDLISTISDPKKFVRRLSGEADGDKIGQALMGLSSFLDLCDQFQKQLVGLDDFPLLQSLLWHHHGYWFDQLRREMSIHIPDALKQFGAWNSNDAKAASPAAEINEVIHRLTSGRYGWRLYELAYRMRA
jgi:hypothetical protein